ncbi:MAG: hypothetical protein N2Z80_03255 [Hydrogenothermaceae bacterium]|nr:hypothetical protein [Hydrogenothermaceae bacterium]
MARFFNGAFEYGDRARTSEIQLFGRGVRLKGKRMSLKRSGDSGEIKILETLNIYGIKADYLAKFLKAIEKEDVEFEAIEIPIRSQHEDKWNSLYILSLSKSEEQFKEEKVLKLEITEEINCIINLLLKVSLYQSEGELSIETTEITAQIKDMKEKLKEVLDLLDWEHIWQEMIEYKKQKEYWNLTFTKEDIRNILASDKYKIYVREEEFEINSKEDLRRIEDIALLVIKKYVDSFYQKKLKHFEAENLRCEPIEEIPFPKVAGDLKYTVYVNKSKSDIIQQIKQLVDDLNELFEKEGGALPRIYFDRSLYVPLLLEVKGDIEKIVPQGLAESEKKFIEELMKCLKEKKDEFEDVELYF